MDQDQIQPISDFYAAPWLILQMTVISDISEHFQKQSAVYI